MSQTQITERTRILALLQPDDNVMANRNFHIWYMLAPLGVTLNIPPFLGQKPKWQHGK